jgi:hypothetical protein
MQSKYLSTTIFSIMAILNPRNFNYKGVNIRLEMHHEIGQGGPEIGVLLIDGINEFPGYFFGSPLIMVENYIYIPVFVKSFIGTGFKIGRVSINSFSVKLYGKKEDIIILDKVEDNTVFYFNSIKRSKIKSIKIVD